MPEDPSLLARLAGAGTPEEAMAPFFFHGSAEPLDGPMHTGGFDGVFWMADCPAVAQCYIPRSGGASLVSIPRYQMGERVRPSRHSDLYRAAILLAGSEPDVEWDAVGQSRSWTIPPGWPTYGAMLEWLRDDLGYAEAAPDVAFWARTSTQDGQTRYMHSDWRIPGTLLAVEARDLRFLDRAGGREADLQVPDHLDLDLFRRAEGAGYDGIVINDFCQSPAWGNVGHRSWGVFASAMHKIRYAAIPAVAFDWPEEHGGLGARTTPEFTAAFEAARSELARAPGM